MKSVKTEITWIVQARLNGAKCYDVKAFNTPSKALRWFDWVLKRAFPTWRGLTLTYRVIRRKVTIETEEEIIYHDTLSSGKKRILLAEVFVPSWIPKRLFKHYKAIPIPGASKKWQPTQQP